jgi:hypothetical protein
MHACLEESRGYRPFSLSAADFWTGFFFFMRTQYMASFALVQSERQDSRNVAGESERSKQGERAPTHRPWLSFP